MTPMSVGERGGVAQDCFYSLYASTRILPENNIRILFFTFLHAVQICLPMISCITQYNGKQQKTLPSSYLLYTLLT